MVPTGNWYWSQLLCFIKYNNILYEHWSHQLVWWDQAWPPWPHPQAHTLHLGRILLVSHLNCWTPNWPSTIWYDRLWVESKFENAHMSPEFLRHLAPHGKPVFHPCMDKPGRWWRQERAIPQCSYKFHLYPAPHLATFSILSSPNKYIWLWVWGIGYHIACLFW